MWKKIAPLLFIYSAVISMIINGSLLFIAEVEKTNVADTTIDISKE